MFYGYKMGMSGQETMNTLYGEFMDYLACDSIINGAAKPKRTGRRMSIEEMMHID